MKKFIAILIAVIFVSACTSVTKKPNPEHSQQAIDATLSANMEETMLLMKLKNIRPQEFDRPLPEGTTQLAKKVIDSNLPIGQLLKQHLAKSNSWATANMLNFLQSSQDGFLTLQYMSHRVLAVDMILYAHGDRDNTSLERLTKHSDMSLLPEKALCQSLYSVAKRVSKANIPFTQSIKDDSQVLQNATVSLILIKPEQYAFLKKVHEKPLDADIIVIAGKDNQAKNSAAAEAKRLSTHMKEHGFQQNVQGILAQLEATTK